MKQKPTLNDLKLVINKWGGRNIPTVYLEGESWYEVLQILANKVYESLEWIDGYFDGDLESILENVLNEWIDDGTIQVIISEALQTQIDDVENTINEMDDRFSSQLAQTIKYVIPENFGAVGDGNVDDTVSVQEAIDYALDNNLALNIANDYNIEGSLFVDKSETSRDPFLIVGEGSLIKNNSGYLFDSTIKAGNVRFKDLTIRSKSKAGMIVFNLHQFIRLYFTNVDFLSVDHLFNGGYTGDHDYAQTIYLNGCTVIGGSGFFMRALHAYDISFSHSVCEHRDSFAYINIGESVRIIDSLIEGLEGTVYRGRGDGNVTINDNYFEVCARGSDGKKSDEPYIDIYDTNVLEGMGFSFRNNFIAASQEQLSNDDFYVVHFADAVDGMMLGGNTSNANLYKVDNINTITPNFLQKAFNEFMERPNDDYVVNNYKVNDVYLGTGNITKGLTRPFPENFTENIKLLGEGSLFLTDDKQLTLSTTANTQSTLGIETIDTFRLYPGTDYVIGVSASARRIGGTNPSMLIEVLNSNEEVIYSHDLQLQASNRRIPQIFPTPSFRVNSGLYKLRISMKDNGAGIKPPTDSNRFTIKGVYLQEGTIPQK